MKRSSSSSSTPPAYQISVPMNAMPFSCAYRHSTPKSQKTTHMPSSSQAVILMPESGPTMSDTKLTVDPMACQLIILMVTSSSNSVKSTGYVSQGPSSLTSACTRQHGATLASSLRRDGNPRGSSSTILSSLSDVGKTGSSRTSESGIVRTKHLTTYTSKVITDYRSCQ